MTELPRVTDIIYSSGIAEGSSYFLPKHRTRGVLTHAACALVGQGRASELDSWYVRYSGDRRTKDMPFDNYVEHFEVKPYVEAFTKWMGQSGWRPAKFEYEVTAGNYVGHVDQVGTFVTAVGLFILDLKNGAEEPWHRLQVAAYAWAYFVQFGTIPRRGCLYLPDAKFVEHKNSTDIGKFKALANAWHVREEFKK